MKTIMITGCSSGFGLQAARHFLDQGWLVVATMRRPDATVLPTSERLRIVQLDVTDPDSIARAIEEAGPIDALVNNAGIGWRTIFESTSAQTIRKVFEANTFGTFEMTRAVLPQMRAKGAGVVVNVSSSVTLKPLPLLSIYTASKAAVNAFTENLALELEPLGIRARLVLPGQAPETHFGRNAMNMMAAALKMPADYNGVLEGVMAAYQPDAEAKLTRSIDVVQAIWRAVTDPDGPLHLPAGADAEALLQ